MDKFTGDLLRLSRNDWICLLVVLLGVLFFLVGANFYNNMIGWTGVFLLAGGVVAWFVLYIYCELFKKNKHRL